MEEINFSSNNVYALTTVPEIKEALGSAVTAMDTWFPHVSKQLVCSWGTHHFVDYANTLLYTTRPGNRKGFPLEVIMELSTVVELHHELFPQFIPLRTTYL